MGALSLLHTGLRKKIGEEGNERKPLPAEESCILKSPIRGKKGEEMQQQIQFQLGNAQGLRGV